MTRLLHALCAIGIVAPALFSLAPVKAQAPTPIRVAYIPIANYAALQVARDKGYFAEEKLSVTWAPVAQGAVAVEAVFGGSVEIGGSAIFETMVARGNGLDVMFVAGGTRIRSAPPDNNGLLVRTDDTIRSAADLAGKKISAGLINSVNYIHMVEWLRKNGVDHTKVEFLEIPFPQMADALFQKRVDAVWNVEPFVTFMTKSGKARVLAYPFLDNIPGMDIANYMAKESWLKANANLARGFKRAIDRGTLDLANGSKEERDDWVAKFTGMKLEVVKDVTLPVFSTEFNPASLQANLDLGVRYKMMKPFDVKTMIWNP